MTMQEQLAALTAEAETLRKKSVNHPSQFTQADVARVDVLLEEIPVIRGKLANQGRISKAIKDVSANSPTQDTEGTVYPPGQRGKGLGFSSSDRTAAFVGNVSKAFTDAAPMIGGPAVNKALINAGSVTSEFSGVIVSEPTPKQHLLSAVTTEPVDTQKGSYLRQTARENNAATVPLHGFKPTSVFGLTPQDWEIATIATLTEPIAKQHIEDYAGLQDFLATQLAFGLHEAVSGFVLNGGTAESGNTVTGILNTSGVGATAFVDSAPRAIRRAITELESAGVAASHVVLNPTDWEDVEFALAQGNWAVGGTPIDRATQKLWSVPVIVDAGMPAGQALIGDLSTVVLAHRHTVRVDWSEASANQGTAEAPEMRDLFRHNELVFRGEVRVGLKLTSPPSLRVVQLAGA